MADTNASASAFGWDFQVNAAIILLLQNIEFIKSIRVEGKTEDIELYLTNGKHIFSQAKSVINPMDFSNTIEKLTSGIETLNSAARKIADYERLIYITNSPNPFNNVRTMGLFTNHTSLQYSNLPDQCKNNIDRIVKKQALKHIDKSKLYVHVIPFYGDDCRERYKIIKYELEEFLFNLHPSTAGMAQNVLEVWQKELFENCTKKDTSITIEKADLLWPVIVLRADLLADDSILQDYDESEIEELSIRYRDFINNKVERFEFATKVIADYQEFEGGKGSERYNRGMVIGKNHFSIEQLIRGLSDKDCSDIITDLESVEYELKRYKHMFDIAEYQKTINIQNNNIVYDSYQDEKEKEINIINLDKKSVESELKRVNDVINENKAFKNYIEKMRLLVQCECGQQIPVNKKNIVGFDDSFQYLHAKRKLLVKKLSNLNEKLKESRNKKDSEDVLVKTESLIQTFDKDILKMNIDPVVIKKVITQLENQKKKLLELLDLYTKNNKEIIADLHNVIILYAGELGVIDYINQKIDYIYV